MYDIIAEKYRFSVKYVVAITKSPIKVGIDVHKEIAPLFSLNPKCI